MVASFVLTSQAQAAAPALVSPLGNNSFDYVSTAGASSSLEFTELIATSSKLVIENTITNSANRSLVYTWQDASSSTLVIMSTSSDITFYNDVKVNSISNTIGELSGELLLIDSKLEANQTEPDASGNATSSNLTPQVVISSQNQEVTVNINNGVDSPSLDASNFVLNGIGVFPKINLLINTGITGIVSVFMPATTTVTSASSTWDGIVSATSTATSLPESYGQNTISPGFELGSTSTMLTFNNAVKIIAPLQAGRGVVYTRGDGIFYDIPDCAANSQVWADANLASAGDCKIDSGLDLVVWTKHFTKFYTYAEQPKASVTYSINGRALKSGESLVITANFDQALLNAPVITLSGANSASGLMATASSTQFSYTYVVGTGNGNVTVSLSSSTNATLVDIVFAPISGATFQVDNTVPSISGGSSYFVPITTSTSATSTVITLTVATTTPSVATSTSILDENSVSIEAISEKISSVTKEAIKNIINAEEKLVKAVDKVLTKRLAGRILLQTETFGQAWYLDPISFKRFYLADGQTSFDALRKFGLGIKNADINKIPVGLEARFVMTDSDSDGLSDKLEEALGTDPNKADTDGDGYNDGVEVKGNYSPLGKEKLVYSDALVNHLRGRIIIQTESRGEAWYVSPVDGRRYYLANGDAAYQIMRYLSLGISNKDISGISVGE